MHATTRGCGAAGDAVSRHRRARRARRRSHRRSCGRGSGASSASCTSRPGRAPRTRRRRLAASRAARPDRARHHLLGDGLALERPRRDHVLGVDAVDRPRDRARASCSPGASECGARCRCTSSWRRARRGATAAGDPDATAGAAVSATGLSTLLVVELARLHDLQISINDLSTTFREAGTPLPRLMTNDAPLLAPADVGDSTMKVGFITVPLRAVVALVEKLAHGPSLQGTVYVEGDHVALVVQLSGNDASSWRVDARADGTAKGRRSTLCDLVEQVALQIHTDLYLNRGCNHEAAEAFVDGLDACRRAAHSTADRARQLERAERAYLRAATTDEGFGLAFYNLGVVYSGQGRDDAAAEAFLAAIQRRPDDWRPYYALGLTYALSARELLKPTAARVPRGRARGHRRRAGRQPRMPSACSGCAGTATSAAPRARARAPRLRAARTGGPARRARRRQSRRRARDAAIPAHPRALPARGRLALPRGGGLRPGRDGPALRRRRPRPGPRGARGHAGCWCARAGARAPWRSGSGRRRRTSWRASARPTASSRRASTTATRRRLRRCMRASFGAAMRLEPHDAGLLRRDGDASLRLGRPEDVRHGVDAARDGGQPAARQAGLPPAARGGDATGRLPSDRCWTCQVQAILERAGTRAAHAPAPRPDARAAGSASTPTRRARCSRSPSGASAARPPRWC